LTPFEGYEENSDLILSIFEKLLKWPEIKNDFILVILSLSESENILLIKSPNVKKYLIRFIAHNLNTFNNKNILYTLLKLYLLDENSGVYENSLKMLISLLQTEQGKVFAESHNWTENLLNYLEIMKENNSIILIRELEIVLELLKLNSNDEIAESVLRKLSACSQFFNYDILTQLTFLDTIENKISESKFVSLILKEINFFQTLQQGTVEVTNVLLRKFLYTLSKFYGGKLISDTNTIKNLFAISIQYFVDNYNENNFIISIYTNTFHNHEIFVFLMDPNNNTQFDFLSNTIRILVENYYHTDPKIIEQILDILTIIGNFRVPSLIQEQFYVKFLRSFYFYEFNKNPIDDSESLKFFFNKLYKDFRTHDFEEYEQHFLDCIFSVISFQPILRIALSHLDYILYILNRRNKPQDICEKKFQVIEYMHKNSFGNEENVEKNLSEQFAKYISKGPF